MAEKKRQANIELLRVVAMAMIVVMHFLRESGSLPADGSFFREGDPSRSVIALFLESFCIIAVNAYVLISGYFGTEGKSDRCVGKVIAFLCRIWFFSLLIPLVLTLLGISTLASENGIYGLITYIFPIGTECYWFASAYFLLLLVSPLLSKGVQALGEKVLYALTGILLLVTCITKSISPLQLATDRYGYDFLWFVVLYLVGACLHQFEERTWKESSGKSAGTYAAVGTASAAIKKASFLYPVSCLLIFGMVLLLDKISMERTGLTYYASVPFHYNFILCLTGAVGFFYLFRNLQIREGKGADIIRFLARYSFGVYLLHEHPDIRSRWYTWVSGLLNPGGKEGLAALAFELLVSLVLIYAAGVLADFVREKLFGRIKQALTRKNSD